LATVWQRHSGIDLLLPPATGNANAEPVAHAEPVSDSHSDADQVADSKANHAYAVADENANSNAITNTVADADRVADSFADRVARDQPSARRHPGGKFRRQPVAQPESIGIAGARWRVPVSCPSTSSDSEHRANGRAKRWH
jgi:hypothetical protein